MDRESVADALLTLAREMTNRTKIAQLREVFEQIEGAQRAGVKNAKIVETLNLQGFKLSVKSFEMMLYRIREQRRSELRQKGGNSATASRAETNTVNRPKVEPATRTTGSVKTAPLVDLTGSNPLRALSGSREPGEFNPIPTAKIEFD